MKILVVDDEPEGGRVVRLLLEACGAKVTEASDAKVGFEALLSSPPDVLISDIGMPDEDGYSFIRRIRELGLEKGGGNPAIALTAYARTEDRMRSIINCFQMHLSKPVESAEFLTMVASLTNRTSLLGAKPA